MRTELDLLDVCLPDYFTGYHRPVIAVPVHNNMTHAELSEAIKDELNSAWDYLCNEDNGFTKTEVLIIEQYASNLLTDPVYKESEYFIGNELDEDPNEDFADFIYAYFSITRKRYHKGILCCD